MHGVEKLGKGKGGGRGECKLIRGIHSLSLTENLTMWNVKAKRNTQANGMVWNIKVMSDINCSLGSPHQLILCHTPHLLLSLLHNIKS